MKINYINYSRPLHPMHEAPLNLKDFLPSFAIVGNAIDHIRKLISL